MHNQPPVADPPQPLLSVVRGEPTAAELAAVVALIAGRRRAGAALARETRPAPASRSEWSLPSALMRTPITAGPGAWRRSALPR